MRDAIALLWATVLIVACIIPLALAANNLDAANACRQTHSADTCAYTLR